ncbi:hypothetical protein JAB1_44260 [Janthinobacterium sp. MP5059B]|uniref:hypothetical protein n=1 Tax=Janthinobacterium sp. MP5059B TaxID=1766683 RepID=UPI000892BB04|nr:hypothetical protein [Janthinobacterium sp. MP5059B]OEZ48006.1 hypothetical protein JAB1_44260 [Janthinobacterium sp. MP5059B]
MEDLMEALSSDLIYQAVKILGAQPDAEDEVEAQVRLLVQDDLTVRRLADVVPEAFGLVLVSHLPGADNMTLPDTFCAQDEDGEWVEFPPAPRADLCRRRGYRPAYLPQRPARADTKPGQPQLLAVGHQQGVECGRLARRHDPGPAVLLRPARRPLSAGGIARYALTTLPCLCP